MTAKKSWVTYLLTLLTTMFMSLQCLRYYNNISKSDGSTTIQKDANASIVNVVDDYGDERELSRQKRFLFFTSNRRLALPAGTSLSFSISLNVNPIRNPPTGYSATMTVGYDISVDLDGLGYASEENPWFVVPFFYFNGGGPGGDSVPGVNLAGGDRVAMYEVLEDIMDTVGILGKPCVQRAICEIFQGPLRNHGFIGEALKLFFTVSAAPFAEERLGDYLAAEKRGKETGDCSFYHEMCLHSLFSNMSANPPKLIPVSDDADFRASSDDSDVDFVAESEDSILESEDLPLDSVNPVLRSNDSNIDSANLVLKSDESVPKSSNSVFESDDPILEKDEPVLKTGDPEEESVPETDDSGRQKRFIYFTRERRIVFPPDSLFFFITNVGVPFRGNVPYGSPRISVSVPIEVVLDDLGLTSEENPFGIWPIFDYEDGEEEVPPRRKRRHSIVRKSDPRFPGGDRDMLYAIVEDAIEKTGLNGRACLLRAICEMFQYPLDNHGFLGEFMELFFSASLSPDAEKRLPEYLAAERAGKTTGKCFAYHEECPYSLFTNPMDSNILNEEEMRQDFSAERQRGSEKTWLKSILSNPSNMAAALVEYLEKWL